MTASGSRLELVRRRLRVARWGIAAVAATGFAGFVFAARAAHPGSSTPASARNEFQATYRDDDGYDSDDDSGQSFSFDSGSIGQGSGAPSVQSSAS
jgi:hypothetical protein